MGHQIYKKGFWSKDISYLIFDISYPIIDEIAYW